MQVEVISPVEDYLTVLKEVFDFGLLKSFLKRSDFKMVFDALHAVTGAYAHPILVQELGADASSIRWAAGASFEGSGLRAWAGQVLECSACHTCEKSSCAQITGGVVSQVFQSLPVGMLSCSPQSCSQRTSVDSRSTQRADCCRSGGCLWLVPVPEPAAPSVAVHFHISTRH